MEDYTMPYYITGKAEFNIDLPTYSEKFAIKFIMKLLEDGNKREGREIIGEPEIIFDYGNVKRGKYDCDLINVYIKQKVRSKIR